MKTLIRILAICLCVAVIYAILSPYIAFRWRQHEKASALRGEPIYNGKPLHEWAMDTQDEDITGGPSPLAIEADKAVQAIGPAAIPWLIKWIKPPITDSRLPGGAVESLKVLGTQAESAIPELVKILNTPSKTLDDLASQTEAAKALSYLGPEVIPFMLTAATNFQGQDVQRELIQDLGNFGTNGVPAIPALVGWAEATDSWVRVSSVIALGNIGMKPEVVIPVLRKALNDSEGLVRSYAADGLASFGKAAKDIVPDLIKMLDDPDYQAQTGAMEVLGVLGEQREIVLPLIVKKLHSNNWVVRRVAAYALGDLGGQQAFDALMQSTDDPEGFVREAVFQSLKKIDPKQLEKSGKKFYTTGQSKPGANQP
jgi:HEAT repeat protein